MGAFDVLNDLNINGHTESKNVGGKDLTYLSWPWAWAEVKKRYPDAHYTIWKNENGLPYTEDPITGFMVYTSVTIEGNTHEMWLPVMDGANRAMRQVDYDYKVKNPKFKYAKWNDSKKGYYDSYGNEQPEYLVKHCEAATMMDINKTIMRCLVKNLAMFGLGLYIYAGEDLPEVEKDQDNEPEQKQSFQKQVNNKEDVPKHRDAPATVTTTDKLPDPKPKNPVKEYVANEITFMKQLLGTDDTAEVMEKFKKMRQALIDGGVIEDVDSDSQTMEQAKAMIDAMYKTFFTDKKDEEK